MISSLTNIRNLGRLDIENNLFPDINFKYHTPQEFANCQYIHHITSEDTFSAFYCNVRNSNANYDNVIALLTTAFFKRLP